MVVPTSHATAPQLLFAGPDWHGVKSNGVCVAYSMYAGPAVGNSCTCGVGLGGGSSLAAWSHGLPAITATAEGGGFMPCTVTSLKATANRQVMASNPGSGEGASCAFGQMQEHGRRAGAYLSRSPSCCCLCRSRVCSWRGRGLTPPLSWSLTHSALASQSPCSHRNQTAA
jgi:hypothetical protein